MPFKTPKLRRKWLVDLLLPRICTFCDCDLQGDEQELLFCPKCRRELQADTEGHCLRCAALAAPQPAVADTPEVTSSVSHQGGVKACPACTDHRWSFGQVIALGQYRSALRTAVLRLKAPQQEPLAAAAAGLLWQFRLDRLRALRADVVTPVPIHWSRRLVRGANAPETIAELLAGHLKIPFETRLVHCRRRTRAQRTLSRADRLANVRGAFAVAKGLRLDGAHVLLVDDIVTTGATCHEIGRALRQAGAASVSVAVLARADESA